jgi:two-component system OmpR family response regulator
VPPRVLIVEDDANVAFVVTAALEYAGFDTVLAVDGLDGFRIAQEDSRLDLILLDVMIPTLDGFEVVTRLRQLGAQVPVIFLTARDELQDRLKGLSLGADDYLTKPFDIEELIARIRAVLRRTGHLQRSGALTCGDLVLDDNSCRVTRGETEIALSPTEYRMLRYLIRNAGIVMTKMQIRDHVWDYGFEGEASAVESFISSLRKKVDTKPPALIQTVRGVGYRLDCPR